jgi:hypothetical protein
MSEQTSKQAMSDKQEISDRTSKKEMPEHFMQQHKEQIDFKVVDRHKEDHVADHKPHKHDRDKHHVNKEHLKEEDILKNEIE